MQNVIKYNNAIIEVGSLFLGLPNSHSSLIKTLIILADPLSGIVNNISYSDIARLLTINPAPGRKDSGTPSKQTVRNYIKSIERECGDYFKVITEGQNLKFFFPEIPKIFNQLFKTTEGNTQSHEPCSLDTTDESAVLEDELNMEVDTEANTALSAVENIFINKNINNNNNNNPTKKLIADDFFPNSEAIATATSLGFKTVCDAAEIADFISYNKAAGSMWADFNPIYIKWLARGKEILNNKNKHAQTVSHKDTRSIQNATAQRTTKPSSSYKQSLRARVIDAWSSELAFNEPSQCFESKPRVIESARIDCDFMAYFN